MTPLMIAYVAIAAICLSVALRHVVVAFRVPEQRIHLLFALAAAAVAGDAASCLVLYWTNDPAEAMTAFAWSGFFLCAAVASLSWFIDIRTGATRRWLVIAETVVATLAVVFGFTTGITYTEVTELRTVVLPWGETVTMGIGPTSPWRWLGDLVNIGFFVILVSTAIRLVRTGAKRQARWLWGSLVLFSLALLAIIPTDLGWISLPGPHTFAFLLIVAAMTWSLSEDLIRASQLSQEVVVGERRWRQLLEDTNLLVARIDRDGRVVEVNPQFVRVLGYTSDEVAGREYWDLVAPKLRDDRRAAFVRGMNGNPTVEVEVPTISRDGRARQIMWRNVVLRDVHGAIEGMLSLGADVTERREAEEALESAVRQIDDLKRHLEEENIYLRDEIRFEHGFEDIVGDSNPLLYVLHKVRQVASSDATVLIHGETGVGKELIARSIHQESHRAGRAFIKVNCAALPPSLIESELFGHERGSFTGADRRRIGRFELADGGTLFLDEVGELPIEIQPKLLRVLQDGELERVGGSETLKVDVRVVAATNRDLRAEMESGRFREDLFYRLEVYPITVPPLRDRQEDIRALVEHFVRSIGRRHGVPITEIPPTVLHLLEQYSWPGNVRELQNVIERAILLSDKGVLRLSDPLEERESETPGVTKPAAGGGYRTLDEVERDHIAKVLASVNGQISGSGGAAKILGLHANTLRYRMKKLGIPTRASKR